MKYSSLLPWTIGSYALCLAYVVSLPTLERNLFLREDDEVSTGSISRYIESPGASGAFAACMVPLLTTQWVGMALHSGTTIANVMLLFISQTCFSLMIAFDVQRRYYIHDLLANGFILITTLYLISTFTWVRPSKRRSLYIALAGVFTICAAVFLVGLYTGAEDTLYYTEIAIIALLPLQFPLRDYLMTS